MAKRTKRIFISDIHLGDAKCMGGLHPYGWFKKNIPVLAEFLDDQLNAPDVKEMVILGDLFDMWVLPVNYDPLISFANISSNPANKLVIDKLKTLATTPDVKLAYVPGNHDMGMDTGAILKTRKFMETTFPGIRFFCNSTIPWGIYNVGTLAAEHGSRYCLFNSPDIWTAKDTFLPLGYFISRIAAYKVLQTGTEENYYDILVRFLRDFIKQPDFVEDMFEAIAEDAGLKPDDIVKLKGVPGFPNSMTVDAIGKRYSNLIQNWTNTPGNINVPAAAIGDLENLSPAASLAYFDHFGSTINIVIFGHTHIPVMDPHDLDPMANTTAHGSGEPWNKIYVNCGSWIDGSKHGCTYVETEEDADVRRHYVRLKSYPSKIVIKEGSVGL
ncbi:MAG TPA: metallophosphoesterase [Syntrophales bacterium]|nr:metallophosphoesterase [Syntrophales bacterium]